ncbi:diguanylate cyclase [Myxococcus stipitatus]|uniref:diguanylate cyclase n=1 Tax=Myxococcus stipitatus TaxID=83455 RepID=UPI0031450192
MLSLTISRDETLEPRLDQEQLFALGLEHVRRLAHRVWTDHNTHDPGVTTLELLCYALTDLSYRTSFPLEDLLATESNNAANMKSQFFTARQVLPMRPLTVLDYRKLLIDLPGVKNAWLLPESVRYFLAPSTAQLYWEAPDLPGVREVHVRGVHRVLVDFMDGVTAEQRAAVLQAVTARLEANRNLGERFSGVDVVTPEEFVLCGELELDPDADSARVKAEILFRVQQYLSPPVPSYSLSEMLEKRRADGSRHTVQDLFEGPALQCGFIDDEELERAELRTELRLSDIISILMDIEGVRAVRDVLINPKGATKAQADKWRVPVKAGRRATLDRQLSRLVLYKRNMPVVPTAAQVEAHYGDLAEAARAKLETVEEYDLPIPLGRARKPERYHSFQNHFPALYGLGPQGLPSGANDARRAQAWQLKAYLLFFDQVMANYCAQLARVRELFSTDPAVHRTYFYQAVTSFTDSARIYGTSDVARTLEDEVEDASVLADRRNRFLEHLLARFAERFHDYASLMFSRFGASPRSLVRAQCEFLRHQPAIGAERGLAYNASLQGETDLWDSENISGLERRVAHLLGLTQTRRRDLAAPPEDSFLEVTTSPEAESHFLVRHRESGEALFQSVSPFASEALARAAMHLALRFAQLPSGYQRVSPGAGQFSFNIVDDTGAVLARHDASFDSEDALETAIDDLMAYVGTHYAEEGMYLLENILLLAEQATDPFPPVCVDPQCTDCADDDPFSFRVQFILPAYAGRFRDMDFRRFAEEVIRQETPAHLLPKVCWVSREDMARVEQAYKPWLELRAGVSKEGRTEKLQALIDALYQVKNVYPVARLAECDSGESRPKFIVGRGALGSGNTAE